MLSPGCCCRAVQAETAGSLWCVVLWASLARAASLVPRAVNRVRAGSRSEAGRPVSRQSGGPTGRPSFGVRPGARVVPSPLAARAAAQAPTLPVVQRAGFGLPNLRRNVCPHFYMTGTRGAIPIQAPHLLKALIRQDTNVSRCQLRGSVHLEQGYVNDVCWPPLQPVRVLRGRADPRVTGPWLR